MQARPNRVGRALAGVATSRFGQGHQRTRRWNCPTGRGWTRPQISCFTFRAFIQAGRIALNNHQGVGLPKHIRRTTKSRERPASVSPWSRATFRFRRQTKRRQRGAVTGEFSGRSSPPRHRHPLGLSQAPRLTPPAQRVGAQRLCAIGPQRRFAALPQSFPSCRQTGPLFCTSRIHRSCRKCSISYDGGGADCVASGSSPSHSSVSASA
jgi:hypothetical protein